MARSWTFNLTFARLKRVLVVDILNIAEHDYFEATQQ